MYDDINSVGKVISYMYDDINPVGKVVSYMYDDINPAGKVVSYIYKGIKKEKMMKKFIALSTSRLRLDNLSGLVDETIKIATPHTAALTVVGEVRLQALEAVNTTFIQLLNRSRASARTREIMALDKTRDAAFREIKAITKAALKSVVPAAATAADKIMLILKPMWNISGEPLASQTAQMEIFLERAAAEADAFATLGLTAVLTVVDTATAHLKRLYGERLDEMSALEGPSATAVSKDVVVAYDDFCTAVEVVLSALPSADVQLVFDEMNELRRKYIAHQPRPLTGKNIFVAPIPNQVYTGKHLTPLPLVSVQTDAGLRELVFAEDFTVSYRNNVDVGEAKLLIHGKGKYAGTCIARFHIVAAD
jgi:hypothetical protein